jgi:hypothetical protein
VEIFIDIAIIFLIKYLEYNLNALKEVRHRSLSQHVSRQESRNSIPSILIESSTGDIFYTPVETLLSPALEALTNEPESDPQAPNAGGLRREFSTGSIVRFQETSDSDTSPLLRRSSIVSVRTMKRGRLNSLVGILYAILGGIVASVTLLLTKSGVDLLLKSLLEPNLDNMHLIFTVVIIIVLAGSAILQVYQKFN